MEFHETDLPDVTFDEVYTQIEENLAQIVERVGDPEINVTLVEIVTDDDPLQQFQNVIRESPLWNEPAAPIQRLQQAHELEVA
jgi:hypothetical protein